ncbi:MAG: DUF4010 domain-containing protein [Acidobacteria bacterium]|jgi:uncharacterized membrane protein (DUF4010 family)|nr:DUF4010 domain-containing protein [Acidobacteriota bacterium]
MPIGPDGRLLWGFAAAFLIGALVGIEREKKKSRSEDLGIGGVRTFVLFSLSGAVAAWLAMRLESGWVFAVPLLGVAALTVAGYLAQARVKPRSLGLTTEVAALTVYLLGGACVAGHLETALALGVALSAILAYKRSLHDLVARLGADDIEAAVKLLVATFIVLPLLPREVIDPWGAIEPRSVWLLVILIAGLSLIGYVATRALGPERGAAVTGLAGGLVSSTAVTLTFARQSRDEGDESADALATGLLLAWGIMFVRIVVEVVVVHPPLVAPLLLPMGAMGLTTLALAAWFAHRSREQHHTPGGEILLSNPFSLTAAAKFALLFTVVLLAVKLAQIHFPGRGYYVVAAVAGLADVDPVTLSMATVVRDGGADTHTGVAAIVLAALTNTVVKCGMIVVLAGAGLRRRAVLATALLLLSGLAAVVLF